MAKIKLAVVGVGNCASSLIQGIYYYRGRTAEDSIGLMNWDIGGYTPCDIEVVAAFDIDKRKVGKDVNEAIFAEPNCTAIFCKDLPPSGVKVSMGQVLDGVSEHMDAYAEKNRFVVANAAEPNREAVINILKKSGAELLINYLPVGSEAATKFYMECALDANLGVVNCIPVFIASDPKWESRFRAKNLPIIGDDIKAQLGATITHRVLTDLFKKRGVKLERTYQINTGGNTDFLNMLNHGRLSSKKISKTEAVQSVAADRMDAENIHIGPSDYVPWQKDNKVCFLRMEGKLFGDIPMNIELRLSVEDSPNSAGVAIDSIRCCKLALERGEGGVLYGPSAYFKKHPPKQYSDEDAHRLTQEFIAKKSVVKEAEAISK
jgi:myo-inositol-1-phosphate synthase